MTRNLTIFIGAMLSLVLGGQSVLAEELFRIGWVGSMTGPVAKYEAYRGAALAEEEINRTGGVLGRRLKLLMEDGKGQGKDAAAAARKLIELDKVRFIVGGHCSPESLAIAPIAERTKTLMVAAITSNPMMTTAGDYIFRVSAISTRHSELLHDYVRGRKELRRIAVLHEDTDYARPPAEYFRELLRKDGIEPVYFQSFLPGETDFRALVTKLRSVRPDALYLGIQAPDTAHIILTQLHDLGLGALTLLGNELMGNALYSSGEKRKLYEGLVFAEPEWNEDAPRTRDFIERFKKTFNVSELTYGMWNAEAYDAVMLLAETINRCGENVEQVKGCLYRVKDWTGAGGEFSIDRNGDGVRSYVLKTIRNGQVEVVR